MISLKLFGERLAVQSIKDNELDRESQIVTPDTAFQQHVFVKVMAKGDGVFRGSLTDLKTRALPDVSPGDIVMVQINPNLSSNSAYKAKGEPFLSIHWGDALGKILDPAKPLLIDNFKPVGKWVFLQVHVAKMAGALFLPDSDTPMFAPGEIEFTLISAGATSGVDLAAGTKIYIDKAKTNLFKLADLKMQLAYIDASYLLGYEH